MIHPTSLLLGFTLHFKRPIPPFHAPRDDDPGRRKELRIEKNQAENYQMSIYHRILKTSLVSYPDFSNYRSHFDLIGVSSYINR